MPDDVPRVDELFSRAVVAQLAEQRAQRETFSELERKLESVERLVSDRLSELSKLLRSGEVELRLEILEEGLAERINSLEKLVRSAIESRLDAVSERLGHLEESVRDEDGSGRLSGLEVMVRERLQNLEDAVRVDDTGRRLAALELAMTERLGHLEETVRVENTGRRLEEIEHGLTSRGQDVSAHLDALEVSMGERLGHLEESVRAEEIGHRLKALELALDERTSRIDEFVRTADLQERLDSLSHTLEERMGALAASTGDAGAGASIQALDQNFGYRLTRLEGALRRLEEQTATRLEDIREANTAAEAGILERIIAESHVVDAHFQAVRPAVEAAAQFKPDLEEALVEVRELMERAAAQTPSEGTGPFSAILSGEDQEEIFLAPEETPIPDRRWPRRDKQ